MLPSAPCSLLIIGPSCSLPVLLLAPCSSLLLPPAPSCSLLLPAAVCFLLGDCLLNLTQSLGLKAKSYREIDNEPMKAMKDGQGDRCQYYGHLSRYPFGVRRIRGQVPISCRFRNAIDATWGRRGYLGAWQILAFRVINSTWACGVTSEHGQS